MIHGFTRKLFTTVLLANTILVGAMMMLLYWSFQRDADYHLQQVETAGLHNLQKALIKVYREEGSWEFMRNDLHKWSAFVRFLPGSEFYDLPDEQILNKVYGIFHRPPPANFGPPRRGMPPPFPGPPLSRHLGPSAPLPDSSSLVSRLVLLDQNKQVVAGLSEGEVPEGTTYIPLRIEEQTIGWLELKPMTWLEQGLKTHFHAKVVSAVLFSSAGALLFSFLVSLPLGRFILRPVNKLIKGVRNLTKGDLSSRIKDEADDEFGDLINNVNNLAMQLEETEKLRQSVMADVSHELRTPLAVLQVEIEAIQDGIRPCNGEQMESLHRSVGNLSRLVDDLFILSLADSGELTCHRQPIDIASLLSKTAELYRSLFAKKNITFEYFLPPEARVSGDPVRLTQVFSNLFNNSYHYTKENGRSELSANLAGDKIEIVVQDSTPGVSEESLKRLFERLYRVDKSRSRAHGGAGLGLSLCKSIIEAHDGVIVANHSPFGGVSMTITLPLIKSIKL